MQTVQGYAVTMGTQQFVAPSPTVTANNVNLTVGPAQFRIECREQIENPGEFLGQNRARAMIAEGMI